MSRVILISIDTLRADHLGCYGYARDTSPRIDELAADGILFENCITQTGHTLPTFTTIMTGRYPFGHGIVSTLYAHPDQPDQVVSDQTPMLAQLLREQGWLTAAFDNLPEFACGPKWLSRGYDWICGVVKYPGRGVCNVLAEEINTRLLPWLRGNLTDGLSLHVHYWDPHQPYNQPDEYQTIHADSPVPETIQAPDGCGFIPGWGWLSRLSPGQRARVDQYDGEITYVDRHVGALLDQLREQGAYDSSWVILTADHGEDMEEHNAPFEHRETYQCNVGVPLIIKPPAGAFGAGTRIDALVGHIDILPTVCDIANIEPPRALDGAGLLPLMSGDVLAAHGHLFTHGGAVKQQGKWRSGEVAVRTQNRKYVLRGSPVAEPGHGPLDVRVLSAPPWRGEPGRPPADWIHYFNRLPKQELYDLREDPYELNDLLADNAEPPDDLQGLLTDYIARRPDLFASGPS